MLINTATTGAEVPTVTVDGSAAELIATAGTEQSDRKTVTTAIYYYETTASSVSISVDRTQDSNLGCIVAATSITGGAIQSWRAYAVAPPLGTPPLTITVPGVDWGQTDFTYGVLVGEDDPTASAFAEVDDGNAQSGTVQMSFGAKVQGFSGSQQSLTWTTSGIADACIGLVVVGSPAVRDTLRIDALPFKMVYSKTGASASVPVSGAYDGTAPTGVEVRVLNYDNDAEVVTWTEVDSSPSGLSWSGSITVPESTSAYKVQARRTGTTDVVESPNRFGVGVWVVDYGQSNSRRHETTSPASDAVGTGSTSTGRRTDGAREGIELVPVGDFGGIAGLISEIESLMGCAVGYVNGAVAANPLSNLKKGTSNYSDLLADLQAIGQDFNVLLWAQGENEGNGVPPAGHKADVIQLHSDLAADLGTTTAAMPMILGPLGPTTIGADDDNWSEISGALIDAADETTDIHLLGGIADTVLVDGVHYTAESYRQIGKRRAYEIARLNGDVTGSAVFRIVGITKVSTTIIDVNLTHGIGTDFTPATGITGLVVSANSDMSSPITPASVVRQDANTIRITLNGGDAIAGAVYVTHLYGANPTVTGLVVDNSTYTMPLLNQFTPLSAS